MIAFFSFLSCSISWNRSKVGSIGTSKKPTCSKLFFAEAMFISGIVFLIIIFYIKDPITTTAVNLGIKLCRGFLVKLASSLFYCNPHEFPHELSATVLRFHQLLTSVYYERP